MSPRELQVLRDMANAPSVEGRDCVTPNPVLEMLQAAERAAWQAYLDSPAWLPLEERRRLRREWGMAADALALESAARALLTNETKEG